MENKRLYILLRSTGEAERGHRHLMIIIIVVVVTQVSQCIAAAAGAEEHSQSKVMQTSKHISSAFSCFAAVKPTNLVRT